MKQNHIREKLREKLSFIDWVVNERWNPKLVYTQSDEGKSVKVITSNPYGSRKDQINRHIKYTVRKYSTCQESQKKQHHEPMKKSDVP